MIKNNKKEPWNFIISILNQGTDKNIRKEALHHLKFKWKHWFWTNKTFWHTQYKMMHFAHIYKSMSMLKQIVSKSPLKRKFLISGHPLVVSVIFCHSFNFFLFSSVIKTQSNTAENFILNFQGLKGNCHKFCFLQKSIKSLMKWEHICNNCNIYVDLSLITWK